MTTEGHDVTRLLKAHAAGEESVLPELFKLVCGELRLVARNQRRRLGGNATMNTTGLVNEVYVKLVEGRAGAGHDRGHFFSIAARAMRQILVDYARAQGRAKRGGDRVRTDLKSGQLGKEANAENMLALDRALDSLGKVDERLVSSTIRCPRPWPPIYRRRTCWTTVSSAPLKQLLAELSPSPIAPAWSSGRGSATCGWR